MKLKRLQDSSRFLVRKLAVILMLLTLAVLLLSGTAMAFGIGIRMISEPLMMALFGSGMIGITSVVRKVVLGRAERKGTAA